MPFGLALDFFGSFCTCLREAAFGEGTVKTKRT
jgi:hypothetical protein